MKEANAPEIETAPLDLVVLNLLQQKIDPSSFDWINMPKQSSIELSKKFLIDLEALN